MSAFLSKVNFKPSLFAAIGMVLLLFLLLSLMVGQTLASEPIPQEGLVLWLDASDLGLTDGAPVDLWPDKALNQDASQETEARRPTYIVDGLNGRPVVRFDGSQALNLTGLDSISGSYTFYFVHDASVIDTTYQFMFDTGDGRFALFHLGSTSGRTGYFDGSFRNAVDAYLDPQVLTFLFHETSADIYRNGDLAVDNFAYTQRNIGGVVAIGSNINQSGSFYKGNIAEIIIYDKALTPAERQKVEGYLAHKYGIAYEGDHADLTVQVDGHGDVSGDFGQGIHSVPVGAQVTLVAEPHPDGGFIRWEVDGVPGITDPEITFTMDANKTVTAVFQEIQVGEGKIFGTVHANDTGNPLEGARVELMETWWNDDCGCWNHVGDWYYTYTDQHGYYEFNDFNVDGGLKADTRYEIEANLIDFDSSAEPSHRFYAWSHDEVWMGEVLEPVEFDIHLEPGGIIIGQVNPAEGPLDGISVEALSINDFHHRAGGLTDYWEDREGHYFLAGPMVPGEYVLVSPAVDRWGYNDGLWEHEFFDQYVEVVVNEVTEKVLVEEVPTDIKIDLVNWDIYDYTYWLEPGWSLISASLPVLNYDFAGHDVAIDEPQFTLISHRVKDPVDDKNLAWATGITGVYNAEQDLLNPASAVFIKADNPTILRLKWGEDHPEYFLAYKDLLPGWNSIGTGTHASIPSVLANIWYSDSDNTGATQVYNPRFYNSKKHPHYWNGFYHSPLQNLRFNTGHLIEENFWMNTNDGFWVDYRGTAAEVVTYSVPVESGNLDWYTDWWRRDHR